MENKNVKIFWDEESGVSTTYIYYNNLIFIGDSICHPDDQDMKSRLTGAFISTTRAEIKYLVHVRDNELIPALKAYRQLYESIKTSKKYNKNSYESIMLMRKIRQTENELDETRKVIKISREKLKNYILEKEELYKFIRERRKMDKTK